MFLNKTDGDFHKKNEIIIIDSPIREFPETRFSGYCGLLLMVLGFAGSVLDHYFQFKGLSLLDCKILVMAGFSISTIGSFFVLLLES